MVDEALQVIRGPEQTLQDLRAKVVALGAEIEAAEQALAAQPARPSPWATLAERIKDGQITPGQIGTLSAIVFSLAVQAQSWEQLLDQMEAEARGPAI